MELKEIRYRNLSDATFRMANQFNSPEVNYAFQGQPSSVNVRIKTGELIRYLIIPVWRGQHKTTCSLSTGPRTSVTDGLACWSSIGRRISQQRPCGPLNWHLALPNRTVRPGVHRDGEQGRAGQGRAAQQHPCDTVRAYTETQLHFIIGFRREYGHRNVLVYITSKRKKTAWKSPYMQKRKCHGEFLLTSEFSDKQFSSYFRVNRNQFGEVNQLLKYVIRSEGCNAQRAIEREEKLAVFLRLPLFVTLLQISSYGRNAVMLGAFVWLFGT
ncbi:hypothetical protein PR048_024759 [Dryococelus australis]|uniref:Uncharacterized protein n=1 Tax=Dryococelus australis TaxID=614101 RepID=A0ABQ9GPI6_9NEOP|nr:hypothetical protein PR048_024759 [Dryococelus australis]